MQLEVLLALVCNVPKAVYCSQRIVSFIVKFINYSWGCKPIPAQYSDHMYTTVNPNTTPARLISIH